MTLTSDQLAALKSGQVVPCLLGQTECVVIRKDIFERMQRARYDDSDWTPEEMLAMAERTFDDADQAGPLP
jgi:hypothetical protein